MAIRVYPDIRANSYATLDEASAILGARLWVDAWNAASQVPSGRGYLVSVLALAGATSITVTGGQGDFIIGTKMTVGNSPTQYTVTAATTSPATTISFSPGLVVDANVNDVVFRTTPNKREQALITATHVLDTYFVWDGTKTLQPELQKREWPRGGVVDCEGYSVDHESIPDFIKVAQSELAASLLERNLFSTPDLLGLGIKEASIPGPISVKISKSQVTSVVPAHVITTLRCYGHLADEVQTGKSKILRTVRT